MVDFRVSYVNLPECRCISYWISSYPFQIGDRQTGFIFPKRGFLTLRRYRNHHLETTNLKHEKMNGKSTDLGQHRLVLRIKANMYETWNILRKSCGMKVENMAYHFARKLCLVLILGVKLVASYFPGGFKKKVRSRTSNGCSCVDNNNNHNNKNNNVDPRLHAVAYFVAHVGLLVITTINTTHLSLRHPATSRNRLVFSASISSMKVSNRWKDFYQSLQVSSYYHSWNLPYICIVWLNRNGSHLVIFWSITMDFGASSSLPSFTHIAFALLCPVSFPAGNHPPSFWDVEAACVLRSRSQGESSILPKINL